MAEIPPQSLHTVAFVDPAGGNSRQALKKVRARSAIVVIGVEPDLQRIFVRHAWAARATTDELVNEMFNVGQMFTGLRQFGIESNAMQALFAGVVMREARAKGIRIPFIEVKQPTNVDKDWRIRSILQPVLAEGRLFLLKNQIELINELRSFPTGKTKDIVDALASAIHMVPMVKPKRLVQTESDNAALAYLRRSGASQEAIEKRASSMSAGRMLNKLRDEFRDGKVG
jgi:predicted phage terminase large subunit-like protein